MSCREDNFTEWFLYQGLCYLRIYFNMPSDLGLKLFQEFMDGLRNKMYLGSDLNVPNLTF